MFNLATIPDFEEVTLYIQERVVAMREPAREWADLARLAVQGQPYDSKRLAILEAYINTLRAQLRGVVLAAIEHFTDEQINTLRKKAGMSKCAWRSLQKPQAITIKNGFSLVIF